MPNMIPRIFNNELLIEIESETPERFLNLCARNNIIISDIKHSKSGFTGTFHGMCEQKVKILAHKSEVLIKVHKRKGIFYKLLFYRIRIGLLLLPLLMIIYLFQITGYIWNVEIEGNYHVTDDQMMHFLTTCSCGYGARKDSIDLETLEFLLREEFKEIIWANAGIEGTCLQITVKENETINFLDDSPFTKGCNIIAKKDGTIISMIVRQGIPLHKIGDTVEVGEELVSGYIPIYNSSDPTTIVDYSIVMADADIALLTNLSCFWYEPKVRYFEIPYGFQEQICYFNINGRMLTFPFSNRYADSRKIVDCYQLSILNNCYLPITFGRMNTFVLNPVYEFRDEDMRRNDLLTSFESYEEALKIQGITILSKEIHFITEPEGTYLLGTLQVIMPGGQECTINSNMEGNEHE